MIVATVTMKAMRTDNSDADGNDDNSDSHGNEMIVVMPMTMMRIPCIHVCIDTCMHVCLKNGRHVNPSITACKP